MNTAEDLEFDFNTLPEKRTEEVMNFISNERKIEEWILLLEQMDKDLYTEEYY